MVGALRLPTLLIKSPLIRWVRIRLPTLRAKIPTDLVGALTHLTFNPLIS